MDSSEQHFHPPQFQTPAGAIIGSYDGNVIRATGIRYARSKRFEAPIPEPPFTAPYIANKKTGCPQISVPFIEDLLGEKASPDFIVDESCQYLSITLPATRNPVGLLPVMVWIHGGSYHIGSCDLATSDPQWLVQEQNVIVVSVNYRLGLFGFLGGYDHRPANLGLLDIREALRWLKKNIEAFGGDPNCITLVGQSAGGDAAANLMIAEDTQDLFKRLIIQSAPLGITRAREKMSKEFSSKTSSINQETPIEEIISTSLSQAPSVVKHGLKAGMPVGLQYGHEPLPTEADMDEAFAQKAPQFDILIGSTAQETSLFTQVSPALARFARFPLTNALLINPLIRYTTKKIYAKSANRFAQHHAKSGGNAYVYTIHWGSKNKHLGSTHCIDLALLFGGEGWENAKLIQPISKEDLQNQGQQLRAVWAEFARTGKLPEQGQIDTDLLTFQKIQ
jgi:para-nitrobenzyl esterase